MTKPYSESCDQNKDPILEVLKQEFIKVKTVLEIGSGTGQHAVYFSQYLPHLHWISSDCEQYHLGIRSWVAEAQHTNISGPELLDVNQQQWPVTTIDAVFSANALHIMDWPSVVNMIKGIGQILNKGGVFCCYGPFNYDGKYTSASNVQFDQWLKQRDPGSGIRDFEMLNYLAIENDMILKNDHEMPANNRILVWVK